MNKLQQEIKKTYDEYVELNSGRKPLFVDVTVRFNGQDLIEDVAIKLVPSTEQEQNGEGDDNEIFFYCDGIDGLLELCETNNGEDFMVIDFFGYFYDEL